MSQFFFITLLILLSIIRVPLSLIVIILRPVVPFFKNRLNFERKNLIDESCLSFKVENNSAHYCFEVSSEGELEQVRPLIEATLSRQKKIEIIYSSPSVEKKCQAIFDRFPSQVRLLRMPLLSSSLFSFLYFQSVWSWVSAPVIIFCRYDFFPELLLLKLFKKKFVLISGAFKKISWYKMSSFKLFDVVVAATDLEQKNFQSLPGKDIKVYSCDFRIPRIAQRYNEAAQTLKNKPALEGYLEVLKNLPFENKLIMGSAWLSDLQILNDKKLIADVVSGKLHILIAPHKLDADFVSALKLECVRLFGSENVEVVHEKAAYNKGKVVILQMSGILCELYSLFRQTYVGGGYERSIHSVLEPFFSNNMVVCGPKISRSTEYDLACEIAPGEIHVLNRPDSFYTIIESSDLTKLNLQARIGFMEKTEGEMKLIIKEMID